MEGGNFVYKLLTEYGGVSQGFNAMQTEAEKAAEGMSGAFDEVASSILTIASTYVAGKLFAFLKQVGAEASRVQVLGEVLKNVGNNAGYSTGKILAQSEAMEKLGFNADEASLNMTKMIQANVDIEKSSALAKVAMNAATIAGTSESEALTRIVQSIQMLYPMTLRSMGITIDLAEAEKEYAKANGVTTAALTQKQKQQIMLNEVLKEGKKIEGTYGIGLDSVAGKMKLLSLITKESRVAWGETFVPAMKKALDIVILFSEGLLKLRERFPALMSLGTTAAVVVPSMILLNDALKKIVFQLEAINLVESSGMLIKLAKGLVGVKAAAGGVVEGVSEMGQAFSGISLEVAKGSGLMALLPKLPIILTAVGLLLTGIVISLKRGNDVLELNKTTTEELAKNYEEIKTAISEASKLQEDLNNKELSTGEKRNEYITFAIENFAKYPELIENMNAPLGKQKELLQEIIDRMNDIATKSFEKQKKSLESFISDEAGYYTSMLGSLGGGEVTTAENIDTVFRKYEMAIDRRRALGHEIVELAKEEGRYWDAFKEVMKTGMDISDAWFAQQVSGVIGAIEGIILSKDQLDEKQKSKMEESRKIIQDNIDNYILAYKKQGISLAEAKKGISSYILELERQKIITPEVKDQLLSLAEAQLDVVYADEKVIEATEKLKGDYEKLGTQLDRLKEKYAEFAKLQDAITEKAKLETETRKRQREEEYLALDQNRQKQLDELSTTGPKAGSEDYLRRRIQIEKEYLSARVRMATEAKDSELNIADELYNTKMANIIKTIKQGTEEFNTATRELEKEHNTNAKVAYEEWKATVTSAYNHATEVARAYGEAAKAVDQAIEDFLQSREDARVNRSRSQMTDLERVRDTEKRARDEMRDLRSDVNAGEVTTQEELMRRINRISSLIDSIPTQEIAGASVKALNDLFNSLDKELTTTAKDTGEKVAKALLEKQSEFLKVADTFKTSIEDSKAAISAIETAFTNIAGAQIDVEAANFKTIMTDGELLGSMTALETKMKGIRSEIDKSIEGAKDLKKALAEVDRGSPVFEGTPHSQGAITGLQTGGLVKGSGKGDIIPTKLEPGEYVVKKAAVDYFGKDFISAINNMKMPTSGKTSGEEITLNLNIGGGSYPLKGEKAVVKELVEALKNSKLVGAY
ncbi:hypothetical protein M0R19_04500 [Candidatus Pacearchaeota archaeon]|jgi:uncharacterized protein YukE|nr:hypothetical protein [Candidatus Pacearchaeota archaeon]